jgi:hypothetical protein
MIENLDLKTMGWTGSNAACENICTNIGGASW